MPADDRPTSGAPQRSPWIRRGTVALRVVLFALAVVAVRHELATIQPGAMWRVLRAYGWSRVALALAFTAVSFLTLGVVEIVTLAAVGPVDGAARHVPRRHALVAAFVSHAFSQSVGIALLSGAAVRLRAYATHGLDAGTVARVNTVVTVTVSLGLMALGAIALLWAPVNAHVAHLPLPSRYVGVLLTLLVLAYLAWSAAARSAAPMRERSWLHPPPPGTAVAQIGLSTFDWLLTATVLFTLLPSGLSLSYPGFLSVYFAAQTISMLSHVPGGAGVFEATTLALLSSGGANVSDEVRAGVAASLVAYRLVYYLVPLATATIIAAVVESQRARTSQVAAPPPAAVAATRPAPVSAIDAVASRAPVAVVDSALEWLIDNADAYDGMLRAIASAQRSVWITQLAFDADCVAYGKDTTVLAEALLTAVSRARVDVRILLNATLLLNTTRVLDRFFATRIAALGALPGTVCVRGMSRFPQFLHAKMVIVDGVEAFLLGSPFANGYWDDARHRPVDTRRPGRELGGRPLHDVSVRVTGRAVAEIQRIFAELWHRVDVDSPSAPHDGAPEPADAHADASPVRVVCTSPPGVLRSAPGGTTRIMDALLDGIASARSLIYVEHQYLSSRRVVAALARALDREPALELVVVLNQNPDVTAYRNWQNARLAEAGFLRHPRVGVFALWSAAHDARGSAILNQVFVHSKVVTVDDRWATTGSANLDGVSLHSYGDDFTRPIARRLFRDVRNFDVNVVVNDDAGRWCSGSVADLRARLWSEHLDAPIGSLADRPPGGWLQLWRGQAAANIAALSGGGANAQAHMRGFVLPYTTDLTPERQLASLGLRVGPNRLDLRFNPSWLEVHFSPNWVRNMFA